jgi:hypothetical protein
MAYTTVITLITDASFWAFGAGVLVSLRRSRYAEGYYE